LASLPELRNNSTVSSSKRTNYVSMLPVGVELCRDELANSVESLET
jgi:hypothetical protein